ncbi:zinc metalloproteinase nas-8-like [Portunus trituberculatus]|uniref:zinc metalloproteinase nas-8-like n=1 Tax=Portunus trituberculatus TaxID=210409 RepID=UPI001E1CD86A|nr:zinc metalloproteinase nas-8-like [Portunus trituberculatus]
MRVVSARASLLTLAFLTLPTIDGRACRKQEEWTPESLVNPEELGHHFEGDIVLPLPLVARNGQVLEQYYWPGGRVPYTIASSFPPDHKATVLEAMSEYTERTGHCIFFHERTTEPDFILFSFDNNQGCSSSVGRQGGMQRITYAESCFKKYGTVLHEMLHALGFYHEHTRYDRDKYVTIHWENIKKNRNKNFQIYVSVEESAFGEEYDYGSVLHYSAYAFSKNLKKTIVTKDPYAKIGQRKGLSPVDLQKLMNMYKC